MKKGRLHLHQYVEWDAVGSAYGYKTVVVHLLKELEKHFDIERGEGPVNVSIVPPVDFIPSKRGANWLVTTVESDTLSPSVTAGLSLADAIVVPSRWCMDVICKTFPTKPVYVVPHGVDPAFGFVERVTPPSKYHRFRYLYVGAFNPRKGLDQLLWCWDRVGFRNRLDVELYLKVSMEPGNPYYDRMISVDNVLMDCRDLPVEKLAAVYQGAHCFVLPTRGEAFALTLAEAMCTGLPCVASSYSGHMDYFDESVGYPVQTFEADMDSMLMSNWFITDKSAAKKKTKRMRMRMPQADQLIGAMALVAQQYDMALEKGRKASRRIVEGFSWEEVGGLMANILVLSHRETWRSEYGVDHSRRPEGGTSAQGQRRQQLG